MVPRMIICRHLRKTPKCLKLKTFLIFTPPRRLNIYRVTYIGFFSREMSVSSLIIFEFLALSLPSCAAISLKTSLSLTLKQFVNTRLNFLVICKNKRNLSEWVRTDVYSSKMDTNVRFRQKFFQRDRFSAARATADVNRYGFFGIQEIFQNFQ